MRLLLVNPAPKDTATMARIRVLNFRPLNLSYLGAMTPYGWDVKIIDENMRPYENEHADLVGLTAITCTAPRAYELASIFRRKGIPTVMGGIHASMLPDEAQEYVDSVVVGEAENVWPGFIRDFEKGEIQRRYHGTPSSMVNMTVPTMSSRSYKIRNLVQTARGCPMRCDFCCVTRFNGGAYRQRPVPEVLDELERVGTGLTVFIDDNILGYGRQAEQRAIELFRGICERGLKLQWASQTSLNFADNPAVMKFARKSGCIGVVIGLETLNQESLKDMHKAASQRTESYRRKVKAIQDHGIGVFGSFIFGSDSDDRDIFARTIDFVLDSKIDGCQHTILTPLPGTELYERLRRENRLLCTNYPRDWALYDMTNVVFRPKRMSAEELREGVREVYKETTSIPASLRKAVHSFLRTRNPWLPIMAYAWNRGYGKNFPQMGARVG